MKVKCVNSDYRNLTQGKVYEVVDKSLEFYCVEDDYGELGEFFKWRFEEFVEQQVESSELFPIY